MTNSIIVYALVVFSMSVPFGINTQSDDYVARRQFGLLNCRNVNVWIESAAISNLNRRYACNGDMLAHGNALLWFERL